MVSQERSEHAVNLPTPSGPAETFDAIVLGAGISGLVAASILSDGGKRRVIVIDEYSHVGGNHIGYNIGGYVFDIGSLIFQDDSPLLKHFPELLPLYVEIKPAWARLNPQGMVTQYPFSLRDDFFYATPWEWCRILSSVVYSRMFKRNLGNARDYAEYWIGKRLAYRSGLENYMRRFYGLPPELIDLDFAEKRMRWLKEQASITFPFRRLFHRRNAAAPTNRQLARPREGFPYLYRAAMDRLERCGTSFQLGDPVRTIGKQGDLFRVDLGDRSIEAQRVVSTIPLERIYELCGLDFDAQLRSVTLISLFFSFSGTRGFAESVLYNFSHEGAWKRLTMYSDFYGVHNDREYFGVEVNADLVGNRFETAANNFREHTSSNKLFKGELILEGNHTLANAYPIYTERAGEKSAGAVAALRAFGIESFGRQGGFDYQPTARVSTLEAEARLR